MNIISGAKWVSIPIGIINNPNIINSYKTSIIALIILNFTHFLNLIIPK